MAKIIKLSPTSTKLLKEFDEAARDWGWTKDQGHGLGAVKSEATYNQANAKLQKRIADLERKARTSVGGEALATRAKVALTLKHINVKGQQGKLIVVDNPFYSQVR